ncbi:MAG TPA: cysteine-rich CWC family protein [Pseudomonas sp.]|nr:cysteine-rich CWC family protein [Pseudomonas sp.]
MDQQQPNDPTHCPACGLSNQCTLANPLTATRPCWCFNVTLSTTALASPNAVENPQACLCPSCAQAQQADAPHAS